MRHGRHLRCLGCRRLASKEPISVQCGRADATRQPRPHEQSLGIAVVAAATIAVGEVPYCHAAVTTAAVMAKPEERCGEEPVRGRHAEAGRAADLTCRRVAHEPQFKVALQRGHDRIHGNGVLDG